MKQIQQKIIDEGRSEKLVEEEGPVINKLEERIKQKNIIWKQNSRIQWLKEGERNTKFFHKAMVQHRQQNKIFSLMDQQGNRLTRKEEMENLLVQHFKGLLIEQNIIREDNIHKISQHIPNLVSRNQNLALLRVITKAEVDEAIKNMEKNKAPRPDGFTGEFFQATWTFMSEDLVNIVEESRCTKRMHPPLNATFLALIPKTKHSKEPQGFRPIALCNVVYKILATIMVN